MNGVLYKDPLEGIIEELNRINPALSYKLNTSMVEIISPSVFIANNGNTNTRATLQARSGPISIQYFQGSKVIYYNRRNVGRVLFGLVIPGASTDYSTSHQVINAVAARYRIPISNLDIGLLNVTDPESILITTRSDSVGYYGSIEMPFEVAP